MARINKSDLTKAKIVQVSCDVFFESGYSNTCHRELGEALEMSKGNITYYYPTKDHLLAAVTERLCEFRTAQFEKRVADGITPIEAVCTELAYTLAISEENEIARDMYLSMYKSTLCRDMLCQYGIERAKRVFAEYCPDLTDEQYAVAESQVVGISFSCSATDIDEALTLESRIRTLLRGVHLIYNIPADEIQEITDKLLSADYLSRSREEYEAFKSYVTDSNEQRLYDLLRIKRRRT